MSFGYLIIVSTSDKVDYLELAYGLALSIKHTQKPGYDQVALVIDDIESVKELNSSWVFDHVIEWDKESFWDGRSWMDTLTPFDNTVCLVQQITKGFAGTTHLDFCTIECLNTQCHTILKIFLAR